jgi:hypothetical protein
MAKNFNIQNGDELKIETIKDKHLLAFDNNETYKLTLNKNTQNILNKAQLLVGQSKENYGEIFNDYSTNKANGKYSHAEGMGTIASADYQHVEGKYNEENENALHIVGNGTGPNKEDRNNAYVLDIDGNAEFSGEITANGINISQEISNKPNLIIGTDIPKPEIGKNGDIYCMVIGAVN